MELIEYNDENNVWHFDREFLSRRFPRQEEHDIDKSKRRRDKDLRRYKSVRIVVGVVELFDQDNEY